MGLQDRPASRAIQAAESISSGVGTATPLIWGEAEVLAGAAGAALAAAVAATASAGEVIPVAAVPPGPDTTADAE